ncbi:MAG: DNA mismatch repair endonuclease MutL [Candidatus Cyclobacteriaceae bacterium M2_1C_046]
MPDIIRLLSDAIANQIAAGEVVQRPASVVKELLENAVDAHATEITLVVKDAGKALIQVIDNGTGMSETDARMSLERHATSKIASAEDLFKIKTMGFRGEALASIAAVSQMEIKTRQENNEIGTYICIEGSEVKKQEPVNTTKGTIITVKNLFYNIPARRNFLKSNGVEMRHITEEFQRVALAYPGIALSLYNHDEEIYSLEAGKLSQRIVGIFGRSYKEQLAACQEETELMNIHGYIGKPDFAKKTRGEQFFFVNKRYIKSNYLNHAVTSAFEGLMPDDFFPFYVLYIDIDPKHIDVNVHPTKTEIKFDDERTIYAIIRSAIKQALSTHNFAPSIDFTVDVNLTDKIKRERETYLEKSYGQFKTSSLQKQNQVNWEKLHGHWDVNREEELPENDQREPQTLTFSSSMHKEEENNSFEGVSNEREQVLFQLHQKYIMTQTKSGLMIIDKQAAFERILFEKYLRQLEQGQGTSQRSLFPEQITLNPADFSLVMEMKEEICALGFIFEPFGNNVVVVDGFPADLSESNGKEIFEGLVEQYKINKNKLSVGKKENLARAMARRASLRLGKRMTPEEMKVLIERLFGCENPNYDPAGKPVYYVLDLETIDKFFST